MDYVTHSLCLRCASLGLGCCSRCRPFILVEDLRLLLRKHSLGKVKEVVEVGEIPTIYLHHLLDPEMAQIYYFWNGVYYRLQTRFVNGACISLFPGKGCTLGDGRPLICKVWPFWWRSGLKPSKDDFPLVINGDCTMATLWNMPIEDILKEFSLSESVIRKQLLTLNKALEEHSKTLKEAMKKNIPPNMLLDWLLKSIL